MKPLIPLAGVLLCLVLALGVAARSHAFTPAAPGSVSWTRDDKLVATYLFYWFDSQTGAGFLMPDGSSAVTDHPPDEEMPGYSYKRLNWHRGQLTEMAAAGIDIVLPVYWGSQPQRDQWALPGLQKMAHAAGDLLAAGQPAPRIGMFLDTTSLPRANGGAPPDLTTAHGQSVVERMMADFFHTVPRALWATIDGRPIVFLWQSGYVAAYDQAGFEAIATRFQSRFGVRPYIVLDTTWRDVRTDDVYGWGAALEGPMLPGGQIASLGPGFDESGAAGRPDPRYRDRDCAAFYGESWESIANASVHLAVIETWNEFAEATEVAPSREYGRTYLDLTARYAARWKAADYGSSGIAWGDLGQGFPAGVGPAFDIPDGDYATAERGGRLAAYPDYGSEPPSRHLYLAVHDTFAQAGNAELWLTVEYFDGGQDSWWVEYDSDGKPYTHSETVELDGSGEWRRHTFHLHDAYFDGRQFNEADLRLVDGYDGQTNYFGRVWLTRAAPPTEALRLSGPRQAAAAAGRTTTLPLEVSGAVSGPVELALLDAPAFVTLDAAGDLKVKPSPADIQPCAYRFRVLATAGAAALPDVLAVELRVGGGSAAYLPAITSGE